MRRDEEQGLSASASFAERAEEHEAEAQPLVWSEAKKTWVSISDIDNDDIQTSTTASPTGSQNALAGNKPLRAISEAYSESREPIYVGFEDDDPDNPFEWSRKKKWIMTIIGSWLTTLGKLIKCGIHHRTAKMLTGKTRSSSHAFLHAFQWLSRGPVS
jgi:hypothetical protein